MADDKDLLDGAFEALASDGEVDEEERQRQDAAFRELSGRREEPGLQDEIFERYLGHGRDLLADAAPDDLDPRIIGKLEPILGDVRGVRVHSGPMATAAARSMEARAFAIGDEDVFIDRAELDMSSDTGVALIAHEVAHTKDPGVAFARRGRQPDTGPAEEFADIAAAAVMKGSRDSSAGGGGGGGSSDEAPELGPDDKRRLAEMVNALLERQAESAAERHGR